MAYAEGRDFYDADSHIMELPTWLGGYADPSVRDRLPGFSLGSSGATDRVREMIARGERRAGVPSERAGHEEELLTRKGWDAYGAFHAADRRRALDLLGFRAQLVFSTFGSYQAEVATDPDVAYGAARALTRGMVDFCAGDPRLLPVTFVPLTIPERAIAETRFALDAGVKGVTISPLPPETHSLTHPSLHPLYALLEERGVPLLFHVEGHAPRKVPAGFSHNGWEGQTDFHGGGENFTGLLYMAVSQWTEIALSALIFDQVLEKFPRLKVGVIELGAVWVPAWLERLEIVRDTFGRTESRIGGLSLRPTEYAKRQIRVTPYPTENVGRLIERCGPEMFLFSSDFPHVEGGRNPLKRFETTLEGRSEPDKEAFYAKNFLDLMGPSLSSSSQVPLAMS
ncbi:MAG TPA: amidohydrolase family protein [Polyangiaceae bacterium]|jgi:predicted TIM-barrel fold metal-dependent hydrolase|nr:amidohydrolase family protein [Polyangiaceae bacterium]